MPEQNTLQFDTTKVQNFFQFFTQFQKKMKKIF